MYSKIFFMKFFVNPVVDLTLHGLEDRHLALAADGDSLDNWHLDGDGDFAFDDGGDRNGNVVVDVTPLGNGLFNRDGNVDVFDLIHVLGDFLMDDFFNDALLFLKNLDQFLDGGNNRNFLDHLLNDGTDDELDTLLLHGAGGVGNFNNALDSLNVGDLHNLLDLLHFGNFDDFLLDFDLLDGLDDLLGYDLWNLNNLLHDSDLRNFDDLLDNLGNVTILNALLNNRLDGDLKRNF